MKKMTKILAFVLSAAMLLSLTACGSFESRLAKAVKKMNDVQNMHMDMNMDLAIGISLLGESMDMEMDMDLGMDIQKEPMITKMDATLSMLGETEHVLSYIEKNGDDFVMYTSDNGGGSWSRQEMSAGELPSQAALGADSLQMFLDCAKNFEEVGEESVLGSAATRYDGTINGEYVAEAMEMTGAWEMLQESLGADFDASGLGDMGDIPTSLWIDKKSGMITRYDMDMTEIMNALTAELMDAVMAENGLSGLGLDVGMEISHVTVSAVLSNFNGVGEIVIPDAAKAA